MRRRPFIPALSVLALLALAIGSSSVIRVAPGELGASSRGWLWPGWHLRLPFSRIVRVPQRAAIEIGPIEAATPAGAIRRISIRLRYRIEPRVDHTLAAEAASRGELANALVAPLGESLGAALRGGVGPLPRTGSGSDPLGRRLVASLEEAGIGAEGFEWTRSGEPLGPPVVPLTPPHRHKILLVGLDAADWQMIDPLIARGRLPSLSRLIRGGARGTWTASTSPTPRSSPRRWA